MNQVLKKLIHHVFPSYCLFCLTKTSGADICSSCQKDLPYLKKSCLICGNSVTSDLLICGKCISTPPPFDKTYALFQYTAPISSLILQLKFNHQLIFARLFGEWMGEFLKNKPRPECIIPVPLHSKRTQERGYNQALEMARPLSKILKIPIEFSTCSRTRYTKPQAELPESDRKSNIHGAFKVNAHCSYHYVAILDDVVTTGQTVSELSRVLKKQGVQKIDIWCCAKT